MPLFKDLTGLTFGNIKVISISGKNKFGAVLWNCECSCGNNFIKSSANIKINMSCKKCPNKSVTHAMSKTREYRIWAGMKNRCAVKKSIGQKSYKDKGIKVCDRWIKSFDNFYSDMGKCPEGFSIDRIDNYSDYSPSNCRWADRQTQQNNRCATIRVRYRDEEKPISDWFRILGITNRRDKQRIWKLIRKGFDFESALKNKKKDTAVFCFNNKCESIPYWGKILGISKVTAYRLYKKGILDERLRANIFSG